MEKLTYFIQKGNKQYEPFLEYNSLSIGIDEMYARQLCTYLVVKETQYELVSNEMEKAEEFLTLKELGSNEKYHDEENYRGRDGVFIEFRKPNEMGRKLSDLKCENHYQVIRFLLKDIVDVPFYGQMYTTSTEIDEDRGCYVVYVRGLYEPVD